MDITLVIVSSFFLGVIACFAFVAAYGFYYLNKIKKKRKKLAEDLKKHTDELESKKASIKEKLLKASDITKAQMSLRDQIELPSKNALHSRHKVGLMYELRDLEKEKIDILKSILLEGYDPMVTVLSPSGTREELALSTYVNNSEQELAQFEEVENNLEKENSKPKNINKFVVYKGGKDDDKIDN